MSKDDGTYVMPWGKYKGRTIEDIESSYLKWLIDNCDDDYICECASHEYEFRNTFNKHF